MKAPDQKVIDDIKEKNPERELLQIEVDHDEETYYAIATIPSRPEWLKFQAELTDPDQKLQAGYRLVLAMTKWPARDDMTDLFKRRPAIVGDFATQITAAAGSSATSRSKKL